MLQPEYNAVTGARKVSAEVKQSVEVAVPLAEEIKKPVSVSAEAYIISKERGESETAVNARAVFHFVYLAEDGYKKSEMTAEANVKIPLGNATATVRTEDARVISVSDGYVAKANLIFFGEAEKQETKTALSGGEGLFVKEFTEEFDAYTGVSEGTMNLEDEFEVNYAVSEVLTHFESAEINEVKSGVSSIIFEGEATVSLSLVPFSENGDIMTERRAVPFRYEMENVGALPDMNAYGNAEIKRVAVKVTADEAKGKSTIFTEIVLGFSGEAVEPVKVSLISDAYSKDSELSVKKDKFERVRFLGQRVFTEKVTALSDGEVPSGCRLVAFLGERLSVISSESANGKIKVVGTITADGVFKNSDNGITVVVAEAPFDVEVDVLSDALIRKISLGGFSARVRNGGIEFEFTVRVVYRLIETVSFEVISEVSEGEPRKRSESSLTIYIPTDGDDLWEIAKTLGESEEDIKRYNPELTFPLTMKDRVIIYRQKS